MQIPINFHTIHLRLPSNWENTELTLFIQKSKGNHQKHIANLGEDLVTGCLWHSSARY